jgi:sigma-B regulation protein RsbU (phosphoserine phosphatase)
VISEQQSTGLFDWKRLLRLAEELVNQESVSAQKELVITSTRMLFGGEVYLWLAETAYPLPGQNDQNLITPITDDMVQRVFDTRQEQYLPDQLPEIPGIYALAVPLVSQNTLLGVLQIIRSPENVFELAEIELVRALASLSAANLQVYRQMVIKNWRFEQLALVRSVSFQIANVLDLDELARRVTRLILHTFRYYYVAIFTLTPGAETLSFRASARFTSKKTSQIDNKPLIPVRLGEGIVGSVAQTGEELVACKVAEQPLYRFIETLPETRSECAFPIKIGERVLGVLDAQSDQTDAFHETEILVLRALADNIALAVEGARLYSAIQKRADQIAIVAEIGRAMTSILDLDALLNQIVDLIHTRFGYPYVHLFTVNVEENKIVFQSGSGPRSQSMRAAEISYDLMDPKGIIPWVARNRRSFLSNDVSLDPLYRPNPLAPTGTRAELALPLVFGADILGVLDIQSDQPNAFDANDHPVFEALADSVAVAIRNANVYQDEQWRRQAAESLRDVAWLLTTNTSLEKVIDAILNELSKNLPCEVGAIWLFEEADPTSPNRNTIRLAAVHGTLPGNLDLTRDIDLPADPILSKALASNQPFIREPVEPLGQLGSLLGYSQDFSEIAISLRAGDQILGIMTLTHPEARRYGNDALSMLATLASYAAVAIENTRLYASAQEQAWISTVLLQVAEATQSLTSIDELAATVVRLTPLLVGVKGCSIFLWDETDQSFSLKATHGIDAIQLTEADSNIIHIGDAAAFDRMFSTRQPVLVVDPAQELVVFPALADDPELTALILTPLIAHNELLGAFLIFLHTIPYNNEELNNTDDERLAIIQGIVQQTAVAIQNIRLLEARQEEAYVTAVLLQVAQTVVSASNLDEVLSSIIQIMPILVGIDCAVIYLWDNDRQVFFPAQYYANPEFCGEVLQENHYTVGEHPILDAVWNKDIPLICPLSTPPEPVEAWKDLPLVVNPAEQKVLFRKKTSLLFSLPLSIKGEKFGVLLAVDSSEKGSRERRLEILSGVAQQISLAIQNDHVQKEMVVRERMEREFHLAREIQRSFLPNQVPEISGWDIDVSWRTARQVGGDFYDFIDLPGNRLGLVVADVSDKGLAAALYMTVTRTLIRATVREIDSPARVLEHVNDLLLSNSQNGLFVTAFYAILDLDSGHLTYANAGHNLPLIVYGKTRQVDHLEHGGTALGAFGIIELFDHHFQLQPGDFLLLYTDGATETFSPAGEIYGEERLSQAMQWIEITSARAILDQIDADLARFRQNEPLSDDLTLLVVKHLARA